MTLRSRESHSLNSWSMVGSSSNTSSSQTASAMGEQLGIFLGHSGSQPEWGSSPSLHVLKLLGLLDFPYGFGERKKQLSEAWPCRALCIEVRKRVKTLQAVATDKILNSPAPGGFLEGKQLFVESVGIRETQEMLSGSDREVESGHTFLHFISGIRTSCGQDGLWASLILRSPLHGYQDFLQMPTQERTIATACLFWKLPGYIILWSENIF